MFLLVPVWYQASKFPTLTSLLIVANVAAFAVLWPMEMSETSVVTRDEIAESAKALSKTVLGAKNSVSPDLLKAVAEEQARKPYPTEALIETLEKIEGEKSRLPPDVVYRWDLVYPVFAARAESHKGEPEQWTPYKRFAFRPSAPLWPGILTHQFLHWGVQHILFNMIFLWTMGCLLEERLGFKMLLVYLAGGAVAAYVQSRASPDPAMQLVGASGAISTLMGYALFSRAAAKVKLFYFMLITLRPRMGFFMAPAWFFLMLWFIQQLIFASLTQSIPYTNVAFVAHLAGFIFGVAVAVGAKEFIEIEEPATS